MANKKKDLAKVAVAALLLAASLPAASHANEVLSQGTLLAAGCGGGCGAATSSGSGSYDTSNPYNRPGNRPGSSYDSTSGSYGSSSSYQPGTSSGYGAGSMSADTYPGSNPGYMNQGSRPNPNRPGNPYPSDDFESGMGSMSSNPNMPPSQRGTNPSNRNR